MIKRYLGGLGSPLTIGYMNCLGALCQSDALNFRQKRAVFAGTNPPPGGAGGPLTPGGAEAKELTLDTLRDQLAAWEKEKKLSINAVTEALKVLKYGDEEAKEKLLANAKEVAAGRYDSGAFEARLPEVKAGSKEKPAVAEDAAEGKEAQPGKRDEIAERSTAISKKIGDLMETVEKATGETAGQPGNKEAQGRKLEKWVKDLKGLNEIEKKTTAETDKKVKAIVDGLVSGKKITEEEGKKLMGLDAYEDMMPEFNRDFGEIAAKLKDEESKLAMEGIKKLKKEQAEKDRKINEDLQKVTHEFREMMNEAGNEVMTLAAREQAIKTLSRDAGVPIEVGKKISFDFFYEDPRTGVKMLREEATIKEISFIGRDTPYIRLESKNPKETDPAKRDQVYKDEWVSATDFINWVHRNDATEILRDQKDLETSIGTKIGVGDTFEFDTLLDSSDTTPPQTTTVKIQRINSSAGEIELDTPVKTTPFTGPQKVLSFGQFARWYKRDRVERTIESLEKLRNELRAFNEAQNVLYDRQPGQYPPIEAKVGEILNYDDGSNRSYVIKEADDKHILFDGSNPPLTPAQFLRWVKENEVEKADSQAEAERETELIGDKDERAKEIDRLKKEKDKAQEGRLLEAEKEAGESPEHHTIHEHALPKVGYLRKLWSRTSLMTPHNLFEFGKVIWEFAKRKMHRREKGTIGTVGEQMFSGYYPELGGEFKSIAQGAENEEVEHHAKVYRTMGIETVLEHLHEAPNKDILKAAITVLCEKGRMRWDDEVFHHNFNKLIQKYGPVPDDKGKDLFIRRDNHMDAIGTYLDKWFGNDTFREYRNKQDSSYNSIKKNFEDHAGRLEGDPDRNGGLRGALQSMLYRHMKGEDVSPSQYEEYLHYAIERGKLFYEDKLYFLMMGVGARGPGKHGAPGQTLLHLDRIGALESALLNNFPILDFYTKGKFPQYDDNGKPIWETDDSGHVKRDPDTGEPVQKKGNLTMHNLGDWIEKIIAKDMPGGSIANLSNPKELKFGEHFRKFLNAEAGWDADFIMRLEKSATDPKRWDHDDMQEFAPRLSESLIEQIVYKQGSSQQTVSTPGLRNAMTGMNNYLMVKMDLLRDHMASGEKMNAQIDLRQISNIMKSFVRLDAVLDDRLYHGMTQYSRFSKQDTDSLALVDGSRPIREHIKEVRDFISTMSHELDVKTGGKHKLVETWGEVIRKPPANKETQTNAVKGFGELLDRAFGDLSQKEIADTMLKIQGSGEKMLMQGIKQAPTTKSDSEKLSAKMFEFQPYEDKTVIGKVAEIKGLEEKYAAIENKTTKQIQDEEKSRLQEIRSEIEAQKYTSKPNDIRILDERISELQAAINQKQRGGGEGAVEKGGQPKAK